MKHSLAFVAAAGLALTGCNRSELTGSGTGHGAGRYAGVGLYQADRMWKQLAGPTPKESAAARIADDSYVIVAIDSRTGELRQCGNLSGRCIGMNPWSTAITQAQLAPATLVKHAEQLDAEALSETNPASSAPAVVEPKVR